MGSLQLSIYSPYLFYLLLPRWLPLKDRDTRICVVRGYIVSTGGVGLGTLPVKNTQTKVIGEDVESKVVKD